MNMKYLLTLATLPLAATVAAGAAKNKPNIVIMIADDCSWNDLGCYGSVDAVTPAIDALARQGMKFNRCYQATAMSTPTRHSLYTGVYPVKSGGFPNHSFVYDHIKSFVQYFTPEGYRTGLIGKQHVAPRSVFSYEYMGGYSTDPEADFDYGKMENFMTRSTAPFFLVVASDEPHTPFTKGDPSMWDPAKLTLPPMLVDTKELRNDMVKMFAEINFLDNQVRQVLDILDRNKLADNTVFIFLSEQGNAFPFAKWTCYKQGLQSAMIIRWPGGGVKSGSQSDAIVEYVDVVPTLMEIAGLTVSPQCDGRSFYGVLKGKDKEHKQYAFALQTTRGIGRGSPFFGVRSVISDRYSYIYNLTPEEEFRNAATHTPVWQSWKHKADSGDEFAAQQVRRYQYRSQEELYDIIADPYSMNNIADQPQYAAVKAELKKALFDWMESQGDPGQATEMRALERQRRNNNVN